MTIGVNREYGHYRRLVGGSRTVDSSKATGRWTWEALAGHACGFERRILGVAHWCSLARSPVSLSALSNLSSTIPSLAAQRVADTIAAKACRGLTRTEESSISANPSSTPASAARKKGLWCRPYKARQRQQNHGNRRRLAVHVG